MHLKTIDEDLVDISTTDTIFMIFKIKESIFINTFQPQRRVLSSPRKFWNFIRSSGILVNWKENQRLLLLKKLRITKGYNVVLYSDLSPWWPAFRPRSLVITERNLSFYCITPGPSKGATKRGSLYISPISQNDLIFVA